MWILDADESFLEGKRVWLRPGKGYLFGRVTKEGNTPKGVRKGIQSREVSKKQFMIDVSPVKPGDGCHIHTKSAVTVIHYGTRTSTVVNGEELIEEKASRRLSGEEHTIMLGVDNKLLLRLKWEPVVFTFSFTTKELKTGDPLARVCSRLEELDVKTVMPYIVDKTTHVVQTKRNTAKGLQALINGKHIVQESFLDALVYAATPSNLENLESLSPLEADYESSWPDPTDHLPPPGREPIPRPAEAFLPNPDRINVFEGYTFVFGDAGQYQTLCDPINNGHGKTLLYEVKSGVTTAEDIAEFMRNAAGKKGLGSKREGRGGVVLVRFPARGQWELDLGDEIAQLTDQRIIEQSEFLDAILENDASPLCRPLPRATEPSQDEPDVAPAPEPEVLAENSPQIVRDSQPAIETSQPLPSQAEHSQEEVNLPTRKRRPMARKFTSKVQNFDDGFDMESIPSYPTETNALPSQKSPPPIEEEPPMDSQEKPRTQAEEEKDVVSDLLPGANAMKRRREEFVQHQKDDPAPDAEPKESPKPKRQKLDVIEAARKRREKEEHAQRQRREEEQATMQETLKDMTVDEMKNLAIVEDMPMPVRERRPQAAEENESNRWDDRWNGRKNFKKFRRKGDPDAPRRRVRTVMVPLEEVKRKDFGIGDHYWVGGDDDDETPQNGNSRREKSPQEPLTSQENGTANGTISSMMSRSSTRPTGTATTPDTSQQPSTQRSHKRPREVRDSDSDDEPRFRFRRKR